MALALQQLDAIAHRFRCGGPVRAVDVERVHVRQEARVRGVDDDDVVDALVRHAHERVDRVLLVCGDDCDAGAASDVFALHLEHEVRFAAARAPDDGRMAEAVLVELEQGTSLACAEGDAEGEVLGVKRAGGGRGLALRPLRGRGAGYCLVEIAETIWHGGPFVYVRLLCVSVGFSLFVCQGAPG